MATFASLLPTPRASDGEKGGPNQRGSKGDLTMNSAVQALLPTPTTVPETGNGHARDLRSETLQLLPTPVVTDSEGSRNSTATRRDPNSRHHTGLTLTDVLLPTPTSQNSHGNEQNGRGEHLLPGVAASLAASPADATSGTTTPTGSALAASDSAAPMLLPTPAASDSGNTPENHLRKKPGRQVVTSLMVLVDHDLIRTGGRIDPQSSGGKAS